MRGEETQTLRKCVGVIPTQIRDKLADIQDSSTGNTRARASAPTHLHTSIHKDKPAGHTHTPGMRMVTAAWTALLMMLSIANIQ